MLDIIRKLLLEIINDIDTDNSNITDSEAQTIINYLRDLRDLRDPKISKYQACQYLNVSRATFDNLVREGVIPKGQKQVGFKELFWRKGDLKTLLKNSTDN